MKVVHYINRLLIVTSQVYFICDSPKDWEVRINNPRNVESTLLDEDTLSSICVLRFVTKLLPTLNLCMIGTIARCP